MVDMIDVAPAFEEVEIRGHKAEVRGIKLGAAARLIQRFPPLWEYLTTSGQKGEMSDEAIAAMLAASVPGLTEASAANLGLDEQLDLLGRIMGTTMPNGVGPFVKALSAAMDRLNKLQGGAPAGQAPKMSAKPSPRSSKSSSTS